MRAAATSGPATGSGPAPEPLRRSAVSARWCASMASTSSAIPSPLDGNQFEDRDAGLGPQVPDRLIRTLAVGLVHHQHVGDFEQSGLRGLNGVSGTGIEDHHGRDRRSLRSRSRTARRPPSRARSGRRPERASSRIAAGTAAARPPRWPRVATERISTSGSLMCSAIRMRSPSSAPPLYGDDGSTARTATRSPRCR